MSYRPGHLTLARNHKSTLLASRRRQLYLEYSERVKIEALQTEDHNIHLLYSQPEPCPKTSSDPLLKRLRRPASRILREAVEEAERKKRILQDIRDRNRLFKACFKQREAARQLRIYECW
jgi:hypothetical protein